MPLPLYIVDAFTAHRFSGNPAAVCLLDRNREPNWMQSVAAEMNLSETAFLLPEINGWRLLWFTPKIEVDLCGHATLAAAHVLWATAALRREQPAVFHTRSGRLTCINSESWIEMDFPAEPAVDIPAPDGILAALCLEGIAIAIIRNRFDCLVEVPDETAVRQSAPDMRLLSQLPVRGTILTVRSDDSHYDFISRFFAPSVGVDEDPVTGSAHCFLAPHWSPKLGKQKMRGYQASPRGGIVGVELRADRVLLSGQAVTVMRGELASD
jgi:predicted PhzF superfamily epimerase YddE/YHI9